MRYLCKSISSKSRQQMRVKIDTKEIFHVISIEESKLTAIMAEDLEKLVKTELESHGKSLIIDMQHVEDIEENLALSINRLHADVYAAGRSFVICGLNPAVKITMEASGVLEGLNTTPTESEAWDIVQMEEIERELGMDS